MNQPGYRPNPLRFSAPGFQLAPGDLEILKLVYQYRIVNLEHLELLTGRGESLKRRIRKLAGQKFVQSIQHSRFEKQVIAIAPAAMPLLVSEGIAPPEELSRRIRTSELSHFFLAHEAAITSFHVILELAGRNHHPLKLESWEQGPETWDEVRVNEDGRTRLYPIRPDALFCLSDGSARRYFFLEMDRSTTTTGRFKLKLRGYYHYLTQDRRRDRHQIEQFHVLAICPTPERAVSLASVASEDFPKAKMFLFGCFNHFSPEQPGRVFAPIYLTPKDFEEHLQESAKRYPGARESQIVNQAMRTILRRPADSWHSLTGSAEEGK